MSSLCLYGHCKDALSFVSTYSAPLPAAAKPEWQPKVSCQLYLCRTADIIRLQVEDDLILAQNCFLLLSIDLKFEHLNSALVNIAPASDMDDVVYTRIANRLL